VAGLSRHPQKDDEKGELCLVQSARGRAALAGRFFLGTRYFMLILYAGAGNRDWGEGCIESTPSVDNNHHHQAARSEFIRSGLLDIHNRKESKCLWQLFFLMILTQTFFAFVQVIPRFISCAYFCADSQSERGSLSPMRSLV